MDALRTAEKVVLADIQTRCHEADKSGRFLNSNFSDSFDNEIRFAAMALGNSLNQHDREDSVRVLDAYEKQAENATLVPVCLSEGEFDDDWIMIGARCSLVRKTEKCLSI